MIFDACKNFDIDPETMYVLLCSSFYIVHVMLVERTFQSFLPNEDIFLSNLCRNQGCFFLCSAARSKCVQAMFGFAFLLVGLQKIFFEGQVSVQFFFGNAIQARLVINLGSF